MGKIRSVIIYLADSISLGSLHFLPFAPSDFNHVCSRDIDRLKFPQMQSFLLVPTSMVSPRRKLIGDSEMGKNLITSGKKKKKIFVQLLVEFWDEPSWNNHCRMKINDVLEFCWLYSCRSYMYMLLHLVAKWNSNEYLEVVTSIYTKYE